MKAITSFRVAKFLILFATLVFGILISSGNLLAHPHSYTIPNLLDPENNQTCKYVIITVKEFRDYFEPLVVDKRARFRDETVVSGDGNITATIVTVYDDYNGDGETDGGIYGNYAGIDKQEKIRNFIRDAHSKWDTEYVLLGGDGDITELYGVGGDEGEENFIPFRSVSSIEDDEDPIADMYYACLDGSYDSSGNLIYGEQGDGADNPYQDPLLDPNEVDLIADVYVGRATADSPQEVINFVSKTLAYEHTYMNADYLGNVLMVGYKNTSDPDDTTQRTWSEDLLTDIMNDCFSNPSYGCFPSLIEYPDFLFEKEIETFGKCDVVDRINGDNYHFINGLNPSFGDQLMKMYPYDANELTNEKYYIGYSGACQVGAFDNLMHGKYPCGWDPILENLVMGQNGAVAYIGSSRVSSVYPLEINPTYYLNKSFWDVIFDDCIYELGKVNHLSKLEHNSQYRMSQKSWRQDFFGYNLLGDPALQIRLTTFQLISPVGGECWIEGEQHQIQWDPGDPNVVGNTVTILYTTNYGLDVQWDVIVADTPNDGSYPWTVPAEISDNVKVKIVAENIDNTFVDISDENFTILRNFPIAYNADTLGLVTPTKDKGNCGGCWAFAATSAFESHLIKHFSLDPVTLDLSEQQQISCNGGNTLTGGCMGGGADDAFQFWKDIGPCTEIDCPYREKEILPGQPPADCGECSACQQNQLPYRVSNTYNFEESSSPATFSDKVKAHVYHKGPGALQYEIYDDFLDPYTETGFWYDGEPGEVYVCGEGASGIGTHYVSIIGWDDNKGINGAYLCMNNWWDTEGGLYGPGPNHDGTFWIAIDGHYNNNMNFRFTNFDVVTVGENPPDTDADGVKDDSDNCINTPNGPLRGTCTAGNIGDICFTATNCGVGGKCSRDQEDTNPAISGYNIHLGNNIGDACECEGNFDCDLDQDGVDAGAFKIDFGRSQFNNPCNMENPCKGDFDCDGNVAGDDAAKFKEDFGRSRYLNPCPECIEGKEWCYGCDNEVTYRVGCGGN